MEFGAAVNVCFDMLMVCGRKGGLQTLIQRSGVVLSSLCASSPPSLVLLRHQQNSGSNSSGSLWACDNRAKVQFCLQFCHDGLE